MFSTTKKHNSVGVATLIRMIVITFERDRAVIVMHWEVIGFIEQQRHGAAASQ
jgi:hypothetical protein